MQEPNISSTPRRTETEKESPFVYNFLEIRKRCFAHAWPWKHLPAAIETEDLVEEALIKIWQAYPSFEPKRIIWPLVKVIANNAFKDACKRYGKYYSEPLDPTFFDVQSLSLLMESETESTNVNTLLGFLTDRQREIIKMSYGIDQSIAYGINEIAEELDITRQTVSSDKKKGLKAMKEGHRQLKAKKKMTL